MPFKKLTSQGRDKPLIVVTGGAGYVGTNVCSQLLSKAYLPKSTAKNTTLAC